MRPTTFIGLAGLIVVGIIIADGLAHPTAVTAAANGTVNLLTPTYGALLGQVPKGYQKAA